MCSCFDSVNERLQEVNTRLTTAPLVEGIRRPLVDTKSLKRPGEYAVLVYASFCPFCGSPYSEDRGGLWSGSTER